MARVKRKVLLVGWDAADWKIIHPLMDAGKMPTVKGLVEGGTMANLATLHPVLSPMLWTSIATGKRPAKHGIHGFSEPLPDRSGVRPITNLSRKTKAVWNILCQNHLACNVIGWWPSHPAEPINGVMVSNHFQVAVGPPDQPWPVPPGAVHPPRMAKDLAGLRINPNELLAEHILPFVPRAAEIDQGKDKRLAGVAKILAECTSVHGVATHLLETTEWDFMAVYYDAIDHFCHGHMKHHPPRLDFVREEDFELYKNVVEMAYIYHDMMLGRLLHLAGEEATVILMSDHGFHPDHRRPRAIPLEPAGPAAEHRDFGILVMHGPGIRADHLIHGVDLLSIAPTVLTLFDLPVGDDMDGQPILEAFERPPAPASIPSWDPVPGEAGLHPPDLALDPVEAREALRQLIELGYIDELPDDREKAVAFTERELGYNLARSMMDGDRYGEAAERLEVLYRAWPDEHRFGVQLALCYIALERVAELHPLVADLESRRLADTGKAQEELKTLLEKWKEKGWWKEPVDGDGDGEDGPGAAGRDEAGEDASPGEAEWRALRNLRARAVFNPFGIHYLRGQAYLAEGNQEKAVEHFLVAEKEGMERLGLQIQLGEAYLRMRRWDEAERCYRRVLELDDLNAHAWLGLARCDLMRRRRESAASHALTSIGLLYHHPLAHFVLGVALQRMGRVVQAIEAYRVALSLNPNFAEAHRRLGRIYARTGEPRKAKEHLRLARDLTRKQRDARDTQAERRWMPDETLPVVSAAAEDGEPAAAPESAPAPDPDAPVITVVSGLPRSGTSMMMRILEQAGLPILSDRQREADEDNPEGYYEYEPVKRTRQDKSWLTDAPGKAVKMVHLLLPHLPPGYRYRVIFMDRDIDEVVASQAKMLERAGQSGGDLSADAMKRVFTAQLKRVTAMLARHPGFESMVVNYNEVLRNPVEHLAPVCEFLGVDQTPENLATVVNPALYRTRGETTEGTE